ncbi:hypothetical protein pb186bvf_006740 [Paramecium bursaria]
MIGKELDYLFKPHSKTLKSQFKKKFWTKGAPQQQYLLSGNLVNIKKNRQQFYGITKLGMFVKLGAHQAHCDLLSSIYVMNVKEKSFEIIQADKIKEFHTQEKHKLWIDILVCYCVTRGLVNQRFQFINQISKGNYSKGFLIEDIKRQQLICKTFQREDLQKVAKLKDSVIGEIVILRKLQHPNIIKLLEVHEDINSIYLVYENLRGELYQSFKKRKSEDKPYSEQQVSRFMFQVFSGIEYLHANEILHRDIKLENILFKDKKSLVLADFGLAAKLGPEFNFKKYGTPGYIAPEVLNCQSYTKKIDIFSAGVVCYILLTQQPVFSGSTINQVLTKNTAGEIDFTFDGFLRLSNEAQQFLKATLSLSDELRPTAQQALKYKFITQNVQEQNPQPQEIGARKVSFSYLSNAVVPQTINLQKARKKSMRQYILLKQALNAQNQIIESPVEQRKSEEDEDELDAHLTVSESVNNIFNSFYTQPPVVNADGTEWEDEESLDGDSSSIMSSNCIDSDEDTQDVLSQKISKLSTLVVKHKFRKNQIRSKQIII